MRKVSVGLELDMAPFVGPAERAKETLGGLGREVDGLDRSINKIPLDAAKAAAALKLMSGEVKDVGTNFEAIGDRSTAMTVLDNRIKNTRAEVKKLGEEFVKTGDVEVFHKLGSASGDLQALTAVRKKLSNALTDGARDGAKDGAKTFASAFQGGIINAFGSLPTELKVAVGEAIVVAIVGASAPIGAAINGVLLAGIGAGGLALGIVGQLHNPLVQAAFSKLGTDLSTKLTSATASFAKPLVSSAQIFGSALSAVLDKLEPRFEGLSHLIEPLARGLAALVTNATPGALDALTAAEPILQEIAAQLPKLGDEISVFLKLIADGGEGAKDGIDLIFLAVETLIVGVGGLVDGLSHLYEWFLGPGKKVAEWWDELTGKPDMVGTHLAGATAATKDFGTSAYLTSDQLKALATTLNTTAVTADTLAAAMTNKLFTATMNIDQAAIGWNRSLLSLRDTLDKNGRALDKHTGQVAMNTKAGLDNRTAVLAAVQANMQQYQAFVAAGGSAIDAAAQYDANTASLVKQMRQAGYTQAQIDGLIGKYKGIPRNVNTAIAMEGLTEAINNLADLLRLINHIPLSKTVRVNTVFTTSGDRSTGSSRLGGNDRGQYGAIRMAAGGLVGPSDPGTFLFGEPQTGGEAFIPLRGIPQSRAMSLAQTVGDNYGFQVSRTAQPHVVVVNGGSAMPPMSQIEHAFAAVFLRLQQQGAI